MAALTSAYVRTIKSWLVSRNSERPQKAKEVEVHGFTVTAADGMPASAFGLSRVDEASVAYYKGGGGVYVVAPNDTKDTLYLFAAVDGSTAPVSSLAVSATTNGLYFTVKGW